VCRCGGNNVYVSNFVMTSDPPQFTNKCIDCGVVFVSMTMWNDEEEMRFYKDSGQKFDYKEE